MPSMDCSVVFTQWRPFSFMLLAWKIRLMPKQIEVQDKFWKCSMKSNVKNNWQFNIKRSLYWLTNMKKTVSQHICWIIHGKYKYIDIARWKCLGSCRNKVLKWRMDYYTLLFSITSLAAKCKGILEAAKQMSFHNNWLHWQNSTEHSQSKNLAMAMNIIVTV